MNLANRHQTVWLSVVAALALSVFTKPSTARAEPGFEAGARLGYGIPMGEAVKNSDLSEGVSGQIPIWLDVGYRPFDALMIGLYFQYGIGFVDGGPAEVCDIDGVDCSASDIRLGIQAHYHISPLEQLDPWLGLGIGYEWLGFSSEGGGFEISSTTSGFEFLNLQAGLDIGVAEHVKVGPFLSFSLGQYDSVSFECDGLQPVCAMFGRDGDIEETAMHEWLVLGVCGAYVP